MGNVLVRYSSRVIIYDHRVFIRLANDVTCVIIMQLNHELIDCNWHFLHCE